MTISLPLRVPRKPKETDLVGACLLHMQRIPGVRPLRNNNGVLTDVRGVPVRYGLGNGSPDIVAGITFGGAHSCMPEYANRDAVMFAFGVELKMSGKKPSPDQLAWHATAAQWGMRVDAAWCVADACDQVAREIERLDDWLRALWR